MPPIVAPLTTLNVEFFAFRIKFEDGSIPPYNFFSELVQSDVIDCWDVDMPTPASVIKNIITKNIRNNSGVNMLTGVLVEATNINANIEIIDITGKIENAALMYGDQDEIEVEEEGTDVEPKKLIFKFKRWRLGVLPEEGILVIERRATGYDRKLAEFLNSWCTKWSKKDPTRRYQSIIIEPYLTGTAPSAFLANGSIGYLEFALSSEVLSEDNNTIFNSDIRDMLKKDKNLVVSIEVKAKRGQAFMPAITTELIELIRLHENMIQKCTSKRVVNNRKTKSVNLINNLHHKVCTLAEDTDAAVLTCAEGYMIELHDDE